MTPRIELSCIEITDPPDRIRQTILENPQSQLLVCRGGLDKPVGIIDMRQVALNALAGESLDLERVIVQPQFVPESAPALAVLERFRVSGAQAALVVNEYGGMEGVVTLGDILEAFVGDIAVPGEPVEASIVEREDGSWLVDGLLSVEEFKDEFDIRAMEGDDAGHFRTVGGFVVNYLGRIPHAGDSFEYEQFRFEVVDMDGKRVDKVLLSRLPEQEE